MVQLFDKNMLLESANPITVSNSLSSNVEIANFNESYFEEGLRFINQMNNEMRLAQTNLHFAIRESYGNSIVINESFSDFVDKVKAIIDKFLEFIKKIAAKFVTAMNSVIKSDAHIKKHKDEILSYGANTFSMDIYNFTRLDDPDFPQIRALKTYQECISRVGAGAAEPSEDTTNKVLAKITAYASQTKDNLDVFYDEFRGLVLGSGESCSATDFEKELFRAFRDGEDTKTNTEITLDHVSTAYNRFEGYSKSIETVNKYKKQMEDEYKKIKAEAKNLTASLGRDNLVVTTVYGKDGISVQDYNANKKEIDVQAKVIINACVDQINHMCNIHTMAFTAKADAIKYAYKQDKDMLYRALKKTQKLSNKEGK